MSRKRKKARPGARRDVAPVRAASRDVGGAASAAALVLAMVGAGLTVDSGADNSFDAPKRLFALFFIAVAALAAFGFSRWRTRAAVAVSRASDARWAAVLIGASLAWAVLSAAVSPRREPSLDALRSIFLYALLLPLGASRIGERRKGVLLGAFVAIAAINAVVSVLQSTNRYQPFPLLTRGGREATGAFVGNPGYLAFALALSAVACLGVCLHAGAWAVRAVSAGGVAVSLAGLLVNRNLTSLTALAAGAVILFLARFGRRGAAALAILFLVSGSAALLYRPLRERAAETLAAARQGDWDRVTTYRLGAWAAAAGMARDRPWTGFGPGTYGSEFVTHRLHAEIETRRRMGNPLTTSSYAEAHSDYLQPFAEAGIPAGIALLAAAFFLFRGLVRASRGMAPGSDRAESVCVLALLGTAAVGALTWFPFQRPISAIPLLLIAGRGWRIAAGNPDLPSEEGGAR